MRSELTAKAKLAGFRAAARVPAPVWRPLALATSRLLAAQKPASVKQWILNFRTVTGSEPTRQQTRQAMYLWLSNTIGSLQLGRYSAQQINGLIKIDARKHQMLLQLRRERGLVLALPHSGSWDLAGAWACLNGLPVTSVAENLPAGQFEYFAAIRQTIGMQIFNQKTPNLIAELCHEVEQTRVVCLLADRDFTRRGVPVSWPVAGGEISLRMPAGPSVIANRTGAAVVPVFARFEASFLRLEIGEPLEAGSVARMTQELGTIFAGMIAKWPTQWHMLQPFFPGVKP